jgi:hypothetical protein
MVGDYHMSCVSNLDVMGGEAGTKNSFGLKSKGPSLGMDFYETCTGCSAWYLYCMVFKCLTL